jgi:hypothetical protein
MFKAFLTSSAAVAILGAAALSAAPAQAQGFGISVGPGGVRVGDDDRRIERRVIERRAQARRVIVEEDDEDEVCETRTRRVMVNGVMRTRKVTTCN